MAGYLTHKRWTEIAIRRRTLLALGAAAAIGIKGGHSAASEALAAAEHHRASTPRFPLRISANNRHLTGADGTPFLLHGDTAWSLIAALDKQAAIEYLDHRRDYGFNTLLVSLIERKFAPDPPHNASGDPPFRNPGDFATPNERYFDHAAWVVRQAAARGFLVLLVPAYCGAGGGDEGWYQAMAENGPQKLYDYGRYLGRRFADLDNIMWCHGGDYDPPDKSLVRRIVEGIRDTAPGALHTAHGASETAVADFWSGESWLHLRNIYTYEDVYDDGHREYQRAPVRPFFLIESAYENEHGASEQRLRAQAYQALLSGGAGHIFGNNPIWHFTGPGIYPTETTWREELDSRGAKSMRHLAGLFRSRPWWKLEPDIDNALLLRAGLVERLFEAGFGSGLERALAARARDGSFAIAYLPDQLGITLDLTKLAGPKVTARWFDPASGAAVIVGDSPFPASGAIEITPPSENSHGFTDWVLVLDSHD